MEDHSDDLHQEGCTYNHCEKQLPLEEIRSKDLKDEQNQAYKNITRDMKDHYGRYHKNNPVTFEQPINNINRSVEVYRDPEANWDYVCVCRRFYRDRSSVRGHFKDCDYFKQVAPFIATRIPTGIITIPLPFTVAPPLKAKRRKNNLDELAHLDMHADILRSTTSQVQQSSGARCHHPTTATAVTAHRKEVIGTVINIRRDEILRRHSKWSPLLDRHIPFSIHAVDQQYRQYSKISKINTVLNEV
ncbi:MAG: hypothetical protein J3Q66DRAFT_393619 [Benniella sp.]|nr:MAG: hypothetical protein J3Q66DRAFT_393619 [Benniella sp.]